MVMMVVVNMHQHGTGTTNHRSKPVHLVLEHGSEKVNEVSVYYYVSASFFAALHSLLIHHTDSKYG